MITGSNFVWLHLPKTGGTSTARLFQQLDLEEITVDDETQDAKHQSLEDRLRVEGEKTTSDRHRKKVIIPSRRLTSWLLSDWHHKTLKMGLQLPFSPVKSGLFFSLRLEAPGSLQIIGFTTLMLKNVTMLSDLNA